jgi:hypothetical protein
MRRKGQGSASISAVVVFLSALLTLGLMATVLPPVANVLSGFREGLRERGERGSELIRIYIHTANETENEFPIITIINGYDKESILTDYVVVARDGRILAAGKMGGSLGGVRIPAGARIDLTPADFGLSYSTFAEMADEMKAIYVRTAEGNSFGSSYGPPPKINPDYQLNISQSSQHIIVIGSTTTRYNFTFNGTLPTTGDALVVKNVILVDPNGFVRGGVTAGNKWSDGSFAPNKIPDSVAAFTQTDVVPIGGYYAVPPFPTDFYCVYYYDYYPYYRLIYGGFSVYSGCDTSPRYIEMVEFYPVEYYTPGSPVTAAAYYARFGGETQTVYNPDLDRMVTITAQRPMTVQYGYGVPGTYPMMVPTIATSTYTTTVVTRITSNTTIFSVTLPVAVFVTTTALRTTTYSTSTAVPVTVWAEGGLVKYAPVSGPQMTATATVPIGSITTQTVTSTSSRCLLSDERGCYWWTRSTTTYTTTYATGTSGSFRGQIKSAIVNGTETLSGDAVAHLAGTVEGSQTIKVKAPIVLLNYIYGIAGSPPASPSGGGGGGGEINVSNVCTLDQSVQSIMPPSSDLSTNQSPLESISGGTVSNFSSQQNTVQVLRSVFCRPVTTSRSSPSPN